MAQKEVPEVSIVALNISDWFDHVAVTNNARQTLFWKQSDYLGREDFENWRLVDGIILNILHSSHVRRWSPNGFLIEWPSCNMSIIRLAVRNKWKGCSSRCSVLDECYATHVHVILYQLYSRVTTIARASLIDHNLIFTIGTVQGKARFLYRPTV